MAEQSKIPLRFKLNESVWLDHHARSAEIISLSLEPNVEIEEDSGFVTIKGYLELLGRFEMEEEEENTLDLESSSLAEQIHYEPFRVEQKEIYQKEYRGKIENRFPVDITVPKEKVRDSRGVYLKIDQFDYSIVDSHRLMIEAEIEVQGITTENKQDVLLARRGNEVRAEQLYPEFDVAVSREELEQEEEMTEVRCMEKEQQLAQDRVRVESKASEDQHDDPPQDSEGDNQTFDYLGNLTRISKEKKIETLEPPTEVEAEQVSSGARNSESQWSKVLRTEVHQVEEKDVDTEQNKAWQEAYHQQTTVDPVDRREEDYQKGYPATLEDMEAEYEASSWRAEETHSTIDHSYSDQHAAIAEGEKQEIKTHFHSSPSVEETAHNQSSEKEREQDKTSNFLSQLMSSLKDNEDDVARLKMCIIQKDESLEDVAKRYEIRLTDIMRYNRLETQEVKAGQILYIPKS